MSNAEIADREAINNIIKEIDGYNDIGNNIVNQTGGGTGEDKEDDTPPIVKLTKKEVTSSTIKVNVLATDTGLGLGTNPIYKYYIKKTAETNYPEKVEYQGSDTTYTFGNLKQNTSYDIKVEVKDKAGNLGIGTLENILTQTVVSAETRRCYKF